MGRRARDVTEAGGWRRFARVASSSSPSPQQVSQSHIRRYLVALLILKNIIIFQLLIGQTINPRK